VFLVSNRIAFEDSSSRETVRVLISSVSSASFASAFSVTFLIASLESTLSFSNEALKNFAFSFNSLIFSLKVD